MITIVYKFGTLIIIALFILAVVSILSGTTTPADVFFTVFKIR